MNSTVYKHSLYFSYANMAVLAITQIILVPQILKYTSQQEYGVYVVLLSVITGLTSIIGWLAGASVRLLSNYYHANNIEEFNKLYSLLKIAFAVYSVVSLFIFYLLNQVYINKYLLADDALNFIVIATFSYVFILINVTADTSVMAAIARLDLLNKYRFYISILVLVTSFYAITIIPTTAVIFVVNAIGVLLVFLCIKYFYLKQAMTIKIVKYWNFDRGQIKSVFIDLGSRALSYSSLRYLLLADPIILSLLISTEDIAMYSYYWLPANFIVLLLWKFSENMQPFFMKNFSSSKVADNQKLYRSLNRKILILSVVAGICYCIIFPYFANLWVGLQDVDLLIVAICGLSIIFLSIYRVDLALLYANIQYGDLIKISLIELLIKYSFVMLFHQQFGFYVSILGHLLSLGVCVFWYARKLSAKQLIEVL